MMTTSPRRPKVNLLTTPLRILSTRGFSRTRSPTSPKRSGSRELKMFSSICWVQSTESKSISILKMIYIMRMKWAKSLSQNKSTTMATHRSSISLNKMMGIQDKICWLRKDQTPPSKRTVIRAAVQPSCITRAAENIPTWSRILITTSRILIRTSWTHNLICQIKLKKCNQKSLKRWITTAMMISHNSITTQTTSWISILRTKKIWIWVICRLTCSSKRKNQKLLSLPTTKNITRINSIRESIKEAHKDVTPRDLETTTLMECTKIRPVTPTKGVRTTEDHPKIINNISRAILTPATTADPEKLHKITSIRHLLNPIFRDSIGQTTRVTSKLITVKSSRTWGRNISPRPQTLNRCPTEVVIRHPGGRTNRGKALTWSHTVNRISIISLNPDRWLTVRP